MNGDLVAASGSRDRVLVPTGDEDADMEMEMEMEVEAVDLAPRPRMGVPKTMRELAESYAQQQEAEKEEREGTPPPPQEEGDDLVMGHVGGSGRRVKGRLETNTRRSRKRPRRRSGSEVSDVDGEEADGTSPKRPSVSVSPVSAPTHASASHSTPGSGRVLRPRPQKSAARVREERAMEEAYRRAVKG